MKETRLCAASELNIVKTLECGQCFRWNAGPDGSYLGVASGRAASLRTGAGEVYIDAPEEALAFWRDYFDLATDYEAARGSFPAGGHLEASAEFGSGIRILRQEPWEALCSFILSQCNNIPRIKGLTERLCALFGEPFVYGGETFHAFPSPETVAALTPEDLAPLRCGYRAPYVLEAARAVASGETDLSAVALLPCGEARAALKRLPGVGDKVADCVLLFGLHRMDAFPVDVWIRRVLKEHFGDSFRPEALGPYAGLAQQYLFYYARISGGKGGRKLRAPKPEAPCK